MRILHTADWHLGKSLHGMSLLEDQRVALEQIVAAAQDERPDVVIIAGDVFDRSSPPPEAVTLLDWAISRLVLDLQRTVIMIAGNHDSGERIACFSGLLAPRGLHLFGMPAVPIPQIILRDHHGPVRFFVLPYLESAGARFVVNDDSITTQQEAYGALLRTLPPPDHERSVFVGHAFVAGGEPSASERQLAVGGAEVVDAELFDRFTYVALGHLHRPQQLLNGKIRYPGSLLAYSFDEAGQQKSFDLVDLAADGTVHARRVAVAPRRAMRRVQGSIVKGEFVIEPGTPPLRPVDFLEVTLRNEQPVADAMAIVQQQYPNALTLHWERARIYGTDTATTLSQLRQKTPIDLLEDFYRTVQGEEMTEEQLTLGRTAVAEVEREHLP